MQLALGYEDLNDHDELRRDPLLALLAGKSDLAGQQRKQERGGKPLAGKSTLQRLEGTTTGWTATRRSAATARRSTACWWRVCGSAATRT